MHLLRCARDAHGLLRVQLTVLYGQNLALTVLYVPESGLDCLISGLDCLVCDSGPDEGVISRAARATHTACFGSRVSGFRFRVSGFRFRVSGFGFRVLGLGFGVSGFGFRVSGFGFRVSGFGVRVSGVRGSASIVSFYYYYIILSGLELSDTNVYAP